MEENQKESNKKSSIILILSAVIAVFSIYMLFTIDLRPKPLAGQGSMASDVTQIGGDFTLTDQDGNEFSSEKMKGHLSLVYFGFTYCPDICPTSLQKLTQVISTLEKYHIELMPIFITIDPKRDNPELLKAYLAHFHKSFIGLSGSEEQIKQVADLYKVFYSRTPDSNQTNYMMDHSSFVYLMDKNGKYMKHFYMSTTPEEIIEYIRINK